MVAFRPREVLAEVARLVGPRARQKGLDLSWEAATEAPEAVAGDPVRLRQVLLNLADNALKFTEQGGMTMHCAAEGGAGDEVDLHFSVADTGIGIPADKLGKIFQPFTQADGSVTRRYGGTGLGLAISAQLVRLMGGRIWAESQPGHGSTFHFQIRCPLAPAPAAAPPAASERDALPVSRLRNLRVLVAEDNAVNKKLIARLLEKLGCVVEVVGDGVEAVEAVERRPFQLILMDVQMPRMGGFEATRIIREREQARGLHTPIVALTAHAMKGDKERCLEAGMDDYVTKPVQFQQLVATLNSLFDRLPLPVDQD
jgi:CheY-like chemotaxis protein